MAKKPVRKIDEKEKDSRNEFDVSIYLKLNSSKIITKLVRIEAASTELKLIQSR